MFSVIHGKKLNRTDVFLWVAVGGGHFCEILGHFGEIEKV